MRIIPLRLLYSGVRSFCRMPDKTAVIIMSEGAEEIEATITIDVLRRGDVKVTVAGLKGKDPVKCARGTVIVPDAALSDVSSDHFDAIILPGGQPGSDSLAAAESVGTLLKKQNEAHRIIAAICAAPIALKSHGIKAQLVTSYPSVRKTMEEGGYKYSEDRVVVSDNIVTSRGPGTAFEFGLKLVELLVGKEKSDSVHDALLIK